MLPKILAVLAMVVVLAAAGGYVIYGSGMWDPPKALLTEAEPQPIADEISLPAWRRAGTACF